MSSKDLFKSARLKIDRASEHIADISTILRKERPFRYILETDAKNGRRSTFAERNEAVVDALSIRCGEAIQHLGSALDYAYSDLVLPFAVGPREAKAVQFPFSETAARLKETCHNRLAHKVSADFVSALLALKPHGEPGGNQLLYFIHALNNPEKHVKLLPVGYYLKVNTGEIRKQVPDFMPGYTPESTNYVANNAVDFTWSCQPLTLDNWVKRGIPASGILHQDITVPIEIFFEGRSGREIMLAVPTLHQFVDAARMTIMELAKFA